MGEEGSCSCRIGEDILLGEAIGDDSRTLGDARPSAEPELKTP